MRRAALCTLSLLCLAASLPAQRLEGRVEELVLDNGMRFLLLNRGEAPIFSGVIRWDVGSVDEPIGLTGIAHMFEHMAFKGTSTIGTSDWEAERPLLERLNAVGEQLVRERQRGAEADTARLASLEAEFEALTRAHRQYVVKDEFDEIYSAAGATGMNATTGRDFTTYYVSLPSNALELWCLLEAARIRDPVLREFYSERDVVAEERRMRSDSDPEGALVETFLATAFLAHPYGAPTIGWPSDIANLTTADAERFRAAHYAPSNAVAALVGNFDRDEARRLVTRYFGCIPPGPRATRILTEEPEQRGERRVVIPWDANPLLLLGFHKPNPPSHTDAVFDVIHAVLTLGRASRLYTRMVKREQLVTAIEAFSFPGDKYPNLSTFYAVPRAPHTPEEVEAVLTEELSRLAREPVTPEELSRVKTQLRADFLRGLRSNMGLALELTYWQLVAGDWRWIERWHEEIDAVTAEEIMETAARYYTPENRTVGILVPRPPAASAQEATPEAAATGEVGA